MTKASLGGNHSRWPFMSLTIICMVSTFALGWCLLQEFLTELLQSRDTDKLYGDIMHTGLIVCIFNISKFYLLLCFGKKLEIVDLVDSEMDGNSTEENDNEVEDDNEDDRDDHEGETQCQVIMEGQQTQSQRLQREQGGKENRVDVNMDAEQNQEEQNFPEINDGQNLEDGTNRQNNEQNQGQISQDYEGSEESVLAPDDNQVHMHESGNKNIQPRRSTRDKKMSVRRRSQSMSEGQNYTSSRGQDDQNIESRKLQRSSRYKEDPGPSKPSQKNKSISNR